MLHEVCGGKEMMSKERCDLAMKIACAILGGRGTFQTNDLHRVARYSVCLVDAIMELAMDPEERDAPKEP